MSTITARARRVEYEKRQVASLLQWARRELGLTEVELAAAAQASTRSVSRWVHATSRPAVRSRAILDQFGELRHALETVFGSDTDAMAAWLHERLPALRGRTPSSAIVEGRLATVLTLLANLDEGVAV